jgi:hypothetical protein
MSWWDNISSIWDGLTGGGDTGMPTPVSGNLSAAGDFGGTPSYDTSWFSGSSASPLSGGTWSSTPVDGADFSGGYGGLGTGTAGLIGGLDSSGSTSAGLSGVSSIGSDYTPNPVYETQSESVGATGGPIADGANGTTATTTKKNPIAGLADWIKTGDNVNMVGNAAKLVGSQLGSTSPTAASQQQAGMATNVYNTGQGITNRAAGDIYDAAGGAMTSNAANEKAYTQRMNAQGYKAGDAAYEAGLADLRSQGTTNVGTAVAQGNKQATSDMSSGASTMNSAIGGLNNLNTQQQEQQSAEAKKSQDAITAGVPLLAQTASSFF